MVTAGFLAFCLFTSNPFERLESAPLDGRGVRASAARVAVRELHHLQQRERRDGSARRSRCMPTLGPGRPLGGPGPGPLGPEDPRTSSLPTTL